METIKSILKITNLKPITFLCLAITLWTSCLYSAPTEYGSISGKVYDEETGMLLDGVEVRAKEQFGMWQDSGSQITVNGAYKIENLLPGPYYIIGKRTGYGTALKTDIPVNPPQETQEQDLYMSSEPGWIYGAVKDDDNQPLGNIYTCVSIRRPDGHTFWINGDDTDAGSGYYELPNLSARNDYQVRIEGATVNNIDYAGVTKSYISVAKGQGTELNFVLPKAAKIYGNITDEQGSPITPKELRCWVENSDAGGYRVSITENAYNISYLLPGYLYTIEVIPPSDSNYIIKRIYKQIPTAGEYPLDIVLEKGAIKISGRVQVQATQQPPQDTPIRVCYWNRQSMVWEETYINGDDGGYLLTNLPRGEAELRVEPHSVYACDGIEEDFQTDTTGMNFELVPESRLSGIIRDSETKEPIMSLLRISYNNEKRNIYKEIHISLDGQFNFTGLPEGIASIQVKPEVNPTGEGYPYKERYVYLAQEEVKTGFDISLKKAALVEINARDANNPSQGIPDVQLFTIGSEGDQHEWYGRTNNNGNAQIRLAPQMSHRVYFENEDDNEWVGFPAEFTIENSTDNKTVHLEGYNSTNAGYITGDVISTAFKQSDAFFEVAGFKAGEVLNKTTIRYVDAIRWYSFEDSQDTGSYSLMLPPNNNYDVYLIVSHYDENDVWSSVIRDSHLNIHTGVSGSISLHNDLFYNSSGGTLSGKVTYNGQPLLMAEVYLEDINGRFVGLAETDNQGIYHLYHVPSGDYQVSARHADYGDSRVFMAGGITDNGIVTTDIIMSDSQSHFLQPNGGENLKGGMNYQIRWSATGTIVDHIRLLYSTDEGLTYPNIIVSNTTNNGEFAWLLPNINSAMVRIKAIAEDKDNNPLAEDESDANFIIVTNHAPELASIGNKSINEWGLLQFAISATDADGDVLVYSVSSLPTGATFDTDTHTFNWTPNYYQAGNYSVTFTVSDGKFSDSETITISVKNVNGPPVLDFIGNKTTLRGKLLAFTIKAIDPDGEKIVYYANPLPPGASFTPYLGRFIWRPLIWQAGDFGITFIASDRRGNRDTESITITVPNTPPVLNPIGDKTVRIGQQIRFRLRAVDADRIDVYGLKYYAYNLPSGATLNNNTGLFEWRPLSSQRGSYRVRFLVKDPPGASDEETITIRTSPATTFRK